MGYGQYIMVGENKVYKRKTVYIVKKIDNQLTSKAKKKYTYGKGSKRPKGSVVFF